MTEGERDPERSGPGRWRRLAGFAVLLTVASILPVSSIVSATGGAGGGEHWPISVPLGHTDPFHLVGYAALAGLVARVTEETRRGLLLAVAATVAFGFAIELVQAPIPWRTFAWRDVAINAVGAVAGAVAVSVRRRTLRSRN